MEHQQTAERPRKGTPGWCAIAWCTSTNFELKILILKQLQISFFHKFHLSFEKNYLFPDITKNHQKKITKKARNVDRWDEGRDL